MTTTCRSSATTTVKMFWIATLLLATTTKAWAPMPVPRHGSARVAVGVDRRLPALGMFDWFNPKPKPAAAAPQEETKPNDFLTSFFNQEPSTTTPQEEPKEEAPAAAATKDATTTTTTTTETVTGQVKWYNPKKGFGFITTSDAEVFVHQSQIQAPGFRFLVEGEAVEFRVKRDDTGRLSAEHVTGPKGGDLQVALRRKARLEKEQQDESQ
jgi:cold shock protein